MAMASVTQDLWQKRNFISYDEIALKFERICYVPNAGSFSVGFAIQNGVSVLTHHGVADLPGDMITCVDLE